MRQARTSRHARRRSGFTLIELCVVILIIGLLLAFILSVSFAGAEQSRLRATQALLIKLETALNDRMEALIGQTATPNGAHRWMASVNPPGFAMGSATMPWGLQNEQRATVIARFDQLKRELPDVFFLQDGVTAYSDYPVNFAGVPFNPFGQPTQTTQYILPLGHLIPPGYSPVDTPPPYAPPVSGTSTQLDPDADGVANIGPGDFQSTNPLTPGVGIFGASYDAAGSLKKLIGLLPAGYDGADNSSPPNGYADELAEGIRDANGNVDAQAQAKLSNFLASHRHVTARSEMLYALLTEGKGPLGPVVGRDEFSDREVRDTDNDGVPEFIDGWGNPLQFYRWPIAYRSPVPPSLQRGVDPYPSAVTPRERYPLDGNSALVNPIWWSRAYNVVSGTAGQVAQVSDKADLFQTYFTSLSDAAWQSGTTPQPNAWDATGFFPRREYTARFLVLSAGPDGLYGPRVLDDAAVRPTTAAQAVQVAAALISAAGTDGAGNPLYPENWAHNYNAVAAEDDITNQNIQNQAGGAK